MACVALGLSNLPLAQEYLAPSHVAAAERRYSFSQVFALRRRVDRRLRRT